MAIICVFSLPVENPALLRSRHKVLFHDGVSLVAHFNAFDDAARKMDEAGNELKDLERELQLVASVEPDSRFEHVIHEFENNIDDANKETSYVQFRDHFKPQIERVDKKKPKASPANAVVPTSNFPYGFFAGQTTSNFPKGFFAGRTFCVGSRDPAKGKAPQDRLLKEWRKELIGVYFWE